MPQIILFIENDEDAIFQNDDISCYILSDTISNTKFTQAVATGKMVLSYGDNALEKCKELRLDGVVKKIDVSKPVKIQLKNLRENLKHKTLGVIIPARRHEAMLAGEIEPEFIAFSSNEKGTDCEIIDWYNELFLIPLAWIGANNIAEIPKADVDFVIVNSKNFENFGC
ncbi:MAG: hypothetical protein E7017_02650 [Alphaproteobacteria bacterium]|nr:hypothetical protein [Alphaproteobacteria bacterium]